MAGQTESGWVEPAYGFFNVNSDQPMFGVEVDAIGYQGTPEPSTFALTGLAALALGAKGIRRWRAARC